MQAHAPDGRRRRAFVLDLSLTFIVALVVGGPLLFTQNGFAVDFTDHLWLGWVQGHAISHGILPAYFTHTTTVGIFNPIFAFYGGTLYTLLGTLGVLLRGRVVVAYELVIFASIVAAYGGFTWLARQCGIRGIAGHVPGIVFVSSAYYVTDLYGRGDIPELIAVSMIPLVVASGANLVRREWTTPGIAIFAFSVVLFTGSHNITLLWGSVVLAVVAGDLWCMPTQPCSLAATRGRHAAGAAGGSCERVVSAY